MFSFLHETNAGNYSLRDLLNILQTSSSDGNWFLTVVSTVESSATAVKKGPKSCSQYPNSLLG